MSSPQATPLGEIVTVIVGNLAKYSCLETFSIHKSIICGHSPFFEAACSERWQQTGKQPIELPDDPVIFGYFVQWLYTGKFEVSGIHGDQLKSFNGESGLDDEMELTCDALQRVYYLGDRLQVADLKDHVVSKIASLWGDQYEVNAYSISANNIRSIYENTIPESKLRKLIVDLWAQYLHLDAVDEEVSNALVPAFLWDLARAVDRHYFGVLLGDYPRHPTDRICSYHEHGEGEHCA
ncbi:MAG: hypothetical protein M1820_010863 [Bogoriella megaspora]|nr:MAG: hypothetical protein M1820_010863 [Bogoriella megaspora]